ncbi:hypothetical protein BN2127_JRS1_00934 [Bacillus cereus]|nr:hypothetical protein BN2127_JRS1_00934 [Bacillus cereus]
MSKYDGLEVLENSRKYGGYTQLTNYAFAFMYRVANAGIVSMERMAVAMDILTFKHGEESVFTSQDTFANRFGCSVKSIKSAVKDLKDVGFAIIGKKGRSNSYDLSPFLKCLASFVEHIHSNVDFCIKTLVKDVLSGEYVPEMVKQEEKKPEPVFDEVITEAINKLSPEDKKEAIEIIPKFLNSLSSESIVYYMEISVGQASFGGYLSTCLRNGSDEQVAERKQEASKPKKQYSKKPVRKERNPDWLKDIKEGEQAKAESKKLFDNTYGVYTQEVYKDTHNKEEAFDNQGKFVAWFKKEVVKYGSKEEFESWCEAESRNKLQAILKRRYA